MKKITVDFVDFFRGFNKNDNWLLTILRKYYEVEISNTPEYLIYSVFGHEHLNYNCIRIFYTGENQSPDFNLCDYAIGFDKLLFGDRYLCYPFFLHPNYIKKYDNRETNISDELFSRNFCSFVVGNLNDFTGRKNFYQLLNEYKHVDSGGRGLNNVGGPVKDKISFIKDYKFNIAFENSSTPGYTTEKILDAFSANTIPIYYGDPEVTEYFNPKAFINCHDYKNFDEVIERVKELDNDKEQYMAMLREEPFVKRIDQLELEKFLTHIIDQPYEKAIRRVLSVRALSIEREHQIMRKALRRHYFPHKVKYYWKKFKKKPFYYTKRIIQIAFKKK